jgi:hypothetical protein
VLGTAIRHLARHICHAERQIAMLAWESDSVTGQVWAQFLTSSLLFIVLPMILGGWRVLRAEVK